MNTMKLFKDACESLTVDWKVCGSDTDKDGFLFQFDMPASSIVMPSMMVLVASQFSPERLQTIIKRILAIGYRMKELEIQQTIEQKLKSEEPSE